VGCGQKQIEKKEEEGEKEVKMDEEEGKLGEQKEQLRQIRMIDEIHQRLESTSEKGSVKIAGSRIRGLTSEGYRGSGGGGRGH
jgi:hypothetical protein